MVKTIIDKDGYIVDRAVFVDEKDNILYTNIQLKEGQTLVEYLDKEQVVNGRTIEYLKPKWTGTEWIETAITEELNEVCPALEIAIPDSERINALEDAITILMGV